VLRYLAVTHFGRGRGQYEEGEAPPFWQQAVAQQFAAQREPLHALWARLADAEGTASTDDAESALAQLLRTHVLTLLDTLHPRPTAGR
jgi:hypothetical protein